MVKMDVLRVLDYAAGDASPPRANAIVGETRPMDATANNAITVLRNITILRRGIVPTKDCALEVGIVLENCYQLRRVRYSNLREPRLVKFKFSEAKTGNSSGSVDQRTTDEGEGAFRALLF